MSEIDLLEGVKGMGETRAQIAAHICASPLAPQRTLTPSGLGMWFSRGRVPYMWRPAVLERLGRIRPSDEAMADGEHQAAEPSPESTAEVA